MNTAGKTILVLGGGFGGIVAASRLRRALPREHRVVPDAGHSALEAGNAHELVSATDRFAR